MSTSPSSIAIVQGCHIKYTRCRDNTRLYLRYLNQRSYKTPSYMTSHSRPTTLCPLKYRDHSDPPLCFVGVKSSSQRSRLYLSSLSLLRNGADARFSGQSYFLSANFDTQSPIINSSPILFRSCRFRQSPGITVSFYPLSINCQDLRSGYHMEYKAHF